MRERPSHHVADARMDERRSLEERAMPSSREEQAPWGPNSPAPSLGSSSWQSSVVAMLVAIAVLLHACVIPAAADSRKVMVAVVELRNEAELRPSEIAYLTDLARSQARQALPGERFLVMTRESIVALLPPGKTLADCAKGQCEVEVGRTIGADYIVTGEVLRFGESMRLNLKVHACQSGDFLGSESMKGAKVTISKRASPTPAGSCSHWFARRWVSGCRRQPLGMERPTAGSVVGVRGGRHHQR
jgi:TolB-like protein